MGREAMSDGGGSSFLDDIATVLMGACCVFFLPSVPPRAKRLTVEED